MFTKMRMTNFKSWKDTGDVRLAPLTGFFGENSSGKSSLLQMLLLLKQTTESLDRNLVLKTGTAQEGYINLGTPQEITHRDEKNMSFLIEWEPQSEGTKKPIVIPAPDSGRSLSLDKIEFETQIHAETRQIYLSQFRYRHEDDFEAALNRLQDGGYAISVTLDGQEAQRPMGRPQVRMRPQKCYAFSDEALRFYQNSEYLNDIVLSFEQQFRELYYLGPLREYPQRSYVWAGETPADVGLKGQNAVHALIAGKEKRVYSGKGSKARLEKRIADWLVTLGLAASFATHAIGGSASQYEVRLKRHRGGHEVLITDMGIGVSQILPVLVLCYYVPEGSTIILEQPELHLHPSVQSGLADVFIDVVQKRGIQLIIESHSEHFIRRLQRRTADGSLKKEQTALYFCDIHEGVSRIQALEMDLFGTVSNWPQGFFGDMAGDMVATLDARLERQKNNGGG